jgi:hypothetical protein
LGVVVVWHTIAGLEALGLRAVEASTARGLRCLLLLLAVSLVPYLSLRMPIGKVRDILLVKGYSGRSRRATSKSTWRPRSLAWIVTEGPCTVSLAESAGGRSPVARRTLACGARVAVNAAEKGGHFQTFRSPIPDYVPSFLSAAGSSQCR